MEMTLSDIEIVNIGGIDPNDYPDFADAYIESAVYQGEYLSDAQLDELNENRPFVVEWVLEWLPMP